MSWLTRALRAPDPPCEPPETRDWSISDPNVITLYSGAPAIPGVTVSEQTILGIPAVYRAVNLIAGTIASLPLHVISDQNGISQRVPSWMDNPGGPEGLTPFEWKETVLLHLLIHGNAFLLHQYGGAGQLLGLIPVHPSIVSVDVDKQGRKTFKVQMANGSTTTHTERTLTHVTGPSTNGVQGLNPLLLARDTFGTAIAAGKSALKLFSSGALMSAIVTPEDDLKPEQVQEIGEALNRKAAGLDNAGSISVFNRKLNFKQWSLSNEDAQWIQARAFQIEEVSRFYGVPPHLLAQTEKQTSWGSGVESQNRAMSRQVLEPWTTRIQERLSRLLEGGRSAEFFYSAFVEPDPETEIRLLIEQVKGGLLTTNEARKIRNLPPVEGGDVLAGATPAPKPEEEPDAEEKSNE